MIFDLQIENPISYKTHQTNIISIPPQKRKKLKKSSLFTEYHCFHLNFPQFLFFSSSGLELQLGHPIASDLQQDVRISSTNNNQALIYYRFLTVFLTMASQRFGRAQRTFALFTENSEKADKCNRPISNDHHDQLHMQHISSQTGQYSH